MSSAPTSPRAAALLLLAALMAGAPATSARADGTGEDGRPVFFRDPDAATARAIDRAVGRFSDPSYNNREIGRDELFDIGYWSVRPLLEVVRKKSTQFRCNSLLVLGRLGDPRALETLRAVAAERDTEWPPVFASLMLGRVRDAEDAAMAVFREAHAVRENEKRKVAVALALGRLHRRRTEEAGAMLERIIDAPTSHPPVHQAALLALGFFRSRVAVASEDGTSWVPSPRIRAALGDSREGLRLSAVLALAVSRLDGFDPLFLELFRTDGDREVRRTALLALGKPRTAPDDSVTDLLTSVLEGTRGTGEERRMAAYLLTLRKDPRSVDALIRTATSPRSAEVAAAAVVALGGIDDPRVAGILAAKLNDRTATVRAAAAVASISLVAEADLLRLKAALDRRLEQGEPDKAAKIDMAAALDEIGRVLRDRDDVKNGIVPRPRPSPEWLEVDSEDLFLRLGRTHREAVLDYANLRVLQVLGIENLFPWRPFLEARAKANRESGARDDTMGIDDRFRRPHSTQFEQYDLRVELDRRPYYTLEDDPEEGGLPPAVPREGR